MASPLSRRVLLAVLAVGFVARVVVRLIDGEMSFLQNSYDFYRAIAASFVAGDGLCFAPGDCARRPPFYPIVLSPFVALDVLYPWVPIVQAAIGTLLAWFVFDLARELYGERAGLVAVTMAALSPYAVIHDTALQETVLVNTLLVAAVSLLVRWRRSGSARTGAAAGVLLGLATLTTTRAGAIALWAVGWAVMQTRSPSAVTRRSAAVVLSAAVLVGAWSIRNWMVVGAPVQNTESGAALWFGNNEWTFKYFPERSIDFARWESRASLSPSIERKLEALGPVREDKFLQYLGTQYISTHPIQTGVGALRKLWVVVSADLSPARSWLTDLGYRLVYLPIHILAAFALWRDLRAGTSHGVLAGTLAAFAVTTAVFWAHTSHKSVIDAFLFVYAAATLSRMLPQRPAVQ